MQIIAVENAVGTVLCHDITKIVPGQFKGRAFKKGHIISQSDIPELLKLGKDHLYVWELNQGYVHENDAGVRICQAIKGQGLSLSEPSEGRVNLIAEFDGMCEIREDLLLKINMMEEIVVATLGNRRPVKKGDVIAGVRIVPLIIEESKLASVEQIAYENAIVSVLPYRSFKVGIVTTGNEVYHGRIQDQFGPVVRSKVESHGCEVVSQIIVPDDFRQISQAVNDLVAAGCSMILTTGGMSVDPDDVTPKGIREAGAQLVTYGAPVLPGAMLMVAYLGNIPIVGLPGCVMYNSTTGFDLILPLILTGQTVTKEMVAKLGMGGLCLKCSVCRYPICPFGTGA
jgi:molybdenum cofactor synthesis domain-containing protein